MSKSTVRYKYCLRVSKKTEAWLERECSKSRWVWNECVNVFNENGKLPKDQRISINEASLGKMLTKARSELSWLKEGSSVIQQQTVREYATSLGHSFSVKGRGRPKHKSSKRSPLSINLTTRGFSLATNDSGNYVLKMPGKHTAVVVTSRQLPSSPKSVRVYQKPNGRWYASFVVQVEKFDFPPVDSAIGIDWGIKTTAVTTDTDCDIDYQGFAKKEASTIRRLDKMMKRRQPKRGQPASRGYRNAKHQRATLFQKITDRRGDHAVKWSNKVVAKHDVIGIEDFKSAFVNRNRSFSKKSHDAAIGALKLKLIQVAASRGRHAILVPPAYTTMTCNSCSAIAKQKLELDVRQFVCEYCHHTDGRDENAAKNIRDIAISIASSRS